MCECRELVRQIELQVKWKWPGPLQGQEPGEVKGDKKQFHNVVIFTVINLSERGNQGRDFFSKIQFQNCLIKTRINKILSILK